MNGALSEDEVQMAKTCQKQKRLNILNNQTINTGKDIGEMKPLYVTSSSSYYENRYGDNPFLGDQKGGKDKRG